MYTKNKFNHNIKIIRTNNGNEFECDELYNNYGILHRKLVWRP